MEFYDVIDNRTSIKKFKSNNVDRQKLSKMISAAMMSPSWKNNTSYRIIIVDDANKKDMLSKSVLNNSDEASTAICEAPILAIFVANPNESGNVDGKEYYLVDSAIAMEHLVLAATAEGLGSCWICALNEQRVKDILHIPANYKVIGMTPIGEIAEDKQHYPKKDTNNYVFLNDWDKSYTENIDREIMLSH